MELEDLRIYTIAMKVADDIWNIVLKWDHFSKATFGKQLIRASDSIAANISEGYGRYYYKEAKVFYYYARGSLFETLTWLTKAYQRNNLSKEEYNFFKNSLKQLSIKLNNFINTVGKQKNEQQSND